MYRTSRKMIAAGHVCLDITPVFDGHKTYQNIGELLVPGKLIHMEPADVHTGGSVANTGLALKMLGVDVQLMGKIGADALGTMVRQIFHGYGAEGLLTDEKSSTSYSVVLAVPGMDRIFLHNPGANDTFVNADIPEESLEDAVLFHFGYPPLMQSMYLNEGEELYLLMKRMKEREIATSLDFAAIDPLSEAGRVPWRELLKKVLPFVDFFVPSFEELCFMLDREKYDWLAAQGGDMTKLLQAERDIRPLAQTLLAWGCKVILIKCGTAGMYYCTADKEVVARTGARLALDVAQWSGREGFQLCYQADCLRSGTGAGDASIAAFLAAVLRGKNPRECVALAAAEGACAVTAYDALSGLQSLEELERRIAAGWKTAKEAEHVLQNFNCRG